MNAPTGLPLSTTPPVELDRAAPRRSTYIPASSFPVLPVVSTFATVRKVTRLLGRTVTAEEVQDALPREFVDQFPLPTIRAEFGALHDHGMGTLIGDRFRFDGDR